MQGYGRQGESIAWAPLDAASAHGLFRLQLGFLLAGKLVGLLRSTQQVEAWPGFGFVLLLEGRWCRTKSCSRNGRVCITVTAVIVAQLQCSIVTALTFLCRRLYLFLSFPFCLCVVSAHSAIRRWTWWRRRTRCCRPSSSRFEILSPSTELTRSFWQHFGPSST